jgi:hypothetical protein
VFVCERAALHAETKRASSNLLPRVIILDTSFFYKADRKSYTALPFADKRRDFMSALRPGCKRSSLIFNTPATHVVCSRWALSFS